jgi:hypothetical protein
MEPFFEGTFFEVRRKSFENIVFRYQPELEVRCHQTSWGSRCTKGATGKQTRKLETVGLGSSQAEPVFAIEQSSATSFTAFSTFAMTGKREVAADGAANTKLGDSSSSRQGGNR